MGRLNYLNCPLKAIWFNLSNHLTSFIQMNNAHFPKKTLLFPVFLSLIMPFTPLEMPFSLPFLQDETEVPYQLCQAYSHNR